MNFLKKQSRLVTFFLVVLIFLQSCRVYHRESVTLNQAVKEEKRVKIKTTNNKTLKFKKIVYEEGKYYGIKPYTFKDKFHKVQLDQNDLKTVRLHNQTLSIILGIISGIAITLTIAVVLFLATWSGPNIGSINFSY